MIELSVENGRGDAEQQKPKGMSRATRLRDGFWLGIVKGTPLLLCAHETRAVVLICPLGNGRTEKERYVVLSSMATGRVALSSTANEEAIVLAMDIQLLRHILGADFEDLPQAALSVVTGADGEVRTLRSAEQILAACALRDCAHDGAVRNVYLKSKALELFALSFGALKWQEHPSPSDTMPPRELERMVQAREILFARIEDPPGLSELAALVGVCETRLKIGFRHAFGETPFGLLRRYRMTLAREFLVGGMAGVSETASRVGYTNVSHFIDAFVRHHGIRPGELVRARRKTPIEALMPSTACETENTSMETYAAR